MKVFTSSFLSTAAVVVAFVPMSSVFAAGSFAGFAGNWRGSGTITMGEGVQEKIRCKGVYAVRPDKQALSINFICASDSYKVNILSDVVAQGNVFSGQWQETTRQVQGSVTGTIPRPGQIQADLQGLGFEMQFSARVNGSRQSVTVLPHGTEVQSVSVILSR